MATFELHKSFLNPNEFHRWEQAEKVSAAALKEQTLRVIEAQGYEEPVTQKKIEPGQIRLVPGNLHESISCNEMNSRKRALILAFERTMASELTSRRRSAKILSADGISRVARILRGLYPFFLGTEYLPTRKDQEKFFPVPHLDLQNIEYQDESFDAFLSGDVFEHVPDLDQALTEIIRVLKPGGMLISSFPFSPDRNQTRIRATINSTGKIEHHYPPQYHGNPIDPEAGSLVFSEPGWDILEKLRSMGCENARFEMIASERHGILSDRMPGPFILVAKKASDPAARQATAAAAATTAAEQSASCNAPTKSFVSLFGLPRSGTTLLTSMFASHPEANAVFEPWNSKQLPIDDGMTPEGFATRLGLNVTARDLLVVKETSTRSTYIENLIALEASFRPITRTLPILIIRNPLRTFLSEVRRRNEWWDNPTKLDQAAFDGWCIKSRFALERMQKHISENDGVVVTLEALSSNTEAVLRPIMERSGVKIHTRQLEYHKHLDRKLVRGDQNLQKEPAEISLDKANTNEDQLQTAEGLLAASIHRDWAVKFMALWQEENNKLSALHAS